jgi:tetratricopeptide (TPR) repeat protein
MIEEKNIKNNLVAANNEPENWQKLPSFEKGLVRFSAGNYDDALKWFTIATEEDHKDFRAYRYKGHTLMKMIREEEAQKAYGEADKIEKTL